MAGSDPCENQMKIHTDCEQGDLNWMKKHIGLPTASGLDQLLDTKFALRTGEMPKTYLYKKLAEAYHGKPLLDLDGRGSSTIGWSAEQGMILEEEARPAFSFETGKTLKKVGFITTDDGLFGCSPDGLIIDNKGKPLSGIEIKSPAPHTHVKYLIGGVLPNDYLAQVHGSMFATGFKSWTFFSYRRSFPPFIIEVGRDEEIIAKIKLAIDKFHADFNEAKKKLMSIDVGELK